MPVVPAEPVVTAACYFLLQAGHGCGLHPAFPAPSSLRGQRTMHHSGMNVPRECGVTSFDRHCEERSDEAIHASASGELDCFASLAMTRKRCSTIEFGKAAYVASLNRLR
jgi:hypothetical protein